METAVFDRARIAWQDHVSLEAETHLTFEGTVVAVFQMDDETQKAHVNPCFEV